MSLTSPVPYYSVQLGKGGVSDYWNWDSLLNAIIFRRSRSGRDWLEQRWNVKVRVFKSRGFAIFSAPSGFQIPGGSDAQTRNQIRVAFKTNGNEVTSFELTQE